MCYVKVAGWEEILVSTVNVGRSSLGPADLDLLEHAFASELNVFFPTMN